MSRSKVDFILDSQMFGDLSGQKNRRFRLRYLYFGACLIYVSCAFKPGNRRAAVSLHPEVFIASRTQAEQLLMSKTAGSAIRHVISIGAPGNPAPAGFKQCASRIRLEFHDVIEDTDSEFGPKARHVETVINFARSIEREGGTLLVHCEHGRSRSSAAALTVFATWLGAGKGREAVDRIYAVQPHARPNSRFIELTDELLGHEGALIAVVTEAVAALDMQEYLTSYARRINPGE